MQVRLDLATARIVTTRVSSYRPLAVDLTFPCTFPPVIVQVVRGVTAA